MKKIAILFSLLLVVILATGLIISCDGAPGSYIGSLTVGTLTAPTGRSATITIAASDASATVKAQADYVCDGTADDVEIEAAINADTTKDVYIRLMGSFFYIASELTITGSQYRTVTIEGDSTSLDYRYTSGTTLKLATNANCNMFANADDTSYRALFLRNLSLDGNNANNTSGNGIYTNSHLWIGDWQHIGLLNVSIQNFDESGINVPAGETTGMTAQGLNVGFNGEYGVFVTYGQGVSLVGPCWFHDNGKTNLYGTFADSMLTDIHVENGLEYGAYLTLTHSVARIWSASTTWHGIVLDTCDTAQINLFVRGACSDLTGCPLAAYPGNIMITNSCHELIGDILVDDYGAQAVPGVKIHSMQNSNLRLNVYGGTYGLHVIAMQTCSNNIIHAGIIRGATAPVLIEPAGYEKNITFRDNQGYIGPGETQSFSGTLTAGVANAIAFAWNNPYAQDAIVKKVTVEVTTAGGTALSVLQVGIADDATGTNLGSEFFTAVPLNTPAIYDSWLAGDTGAQTKWVLLQDSASATDDWVVGKILTQNASNLVGKWYVEVVGR